MFDEAVAKVVAGALIAASIVWAARDRSGGVVSDEQLRRKQLREELAALRKDLAEVKKLVKLVESSYGRK